jgi:Sensors of blue-light using FAD
MSAVGSFAPSTLSHRSAPLSTLVYRSRAACAFSEAELHTLLQVAQARNRAESVTGLLIYDEGCFFQWLEGPAHGLSRVWRSIRRDPRHTDIEIVGDMPTPMRFFGDWALKLAQRPPGTGHAVASQAIPVPPQILATLYRCPQAAPALMAALTPSSAVSRLAPETAHRDEPRALLKRVVTRVALPSLTARLTGQTMPVPPPPHTRVDELAGLLIAADPAEAYGLIGAVQASADSLGALLASLFEPSARRLGDLWGTDDCSELDVTIGLCRLHTALRRMNLVAPRPPAACADPGVVLVAPQPGEMHMLGAVLDAEVLWRSGWQTRCEFPATNEALQDLLAGTRFDAVDLSLSPAFRREHRLARMAETIRLARLASRNPDLRVVVSGRAFVEPCDACSQVGADAVSQSAAQIDVLIGRCPRGPR